VPTDNDPVSVVMPVRNAMPYLDEAVASILAQTHPHFDLVIGDDGSTDGSRERLQEWALRDSRIRLLFNDGGRLGPTGSGNWVTRAAIHPIIARMDADDLSMPDRLRRQLLALKADPGAALAGSLFDQVDVAGRRVGKRDRSVFCDPRCVFPVAHGSMMFRRAAFDRIGGYRAECDYWEDLDFFIRMGREGRILILPESLYRYRYSPTSSRLVSNDAAVARALDLCVRCLDLHRQGRDYDLLLVEAARAPARDEVAPSVLAQIAVDRLWRGDARTILTSWARRHTRLRPNMRSARILVFACWAWISPGTLRALMRLRASRADRRARHLVQDGTVYTWQIRARDNAVPARVDSMARAGAPAEDSRRDAEPRVPAVAQFGVL
jgi:hypothetical protein